MDLSYEKDEMNFATNETAGSEMPLQQSQPASLINQYIYPAANNFMTKSNAPVTVKQNMIRKYYAMRVYYVLSFFFLFATYTSSYYISKNVLYYFYELKMFNLLFPDIFYFFSREFLSMPLKT